MSVSKRRPPKPDPRAEPDDLPTDAPVDVVPKEAIAVAPQRPHAPAPSHEAASPPAEPAALDTPVENPPRAAPRVELESPVARAKAEAVDPRLAALEPLLAANDWSAVAERLGPPDRVAELPPALALIYAVARKELQSANSEIRGDNEAAIRAMAQLLGSDPASTVALLLTKRLLRKNPVSIRRRPAPRASVSVAIIVVGVLLGVVVGYAVQFGPWSHHVTGTRGVRALAGGQ